MLTAWAWSAEQGRTYLKLTEQAPGAVVELEVVDFQRPPKSSTPFSQEERAGTRCDLRPMLLSLGRSPTPLPSAVCVSDGKDGEYSPARYSKWGS